MIMYAWVSRPFNLSKLGTWQFVLTINHVQKIAYGMKDTPIAYNLLGTPGLPQIKQINKVHIIESYNTLREAAYILDKAVPYEMVLQAGSLSFSPILKYRAWLPWNQVGGRGHQFTLPQIALLFHEIQFLILTIILGWWRAPLKSQELCLQMLWNIKRNNPIFMDL
jgi:hypothetical protein